MITQYINNKLNYQIDFKIKKIIINIDYIYMDNIDIILNISENDINKLINFICSKDKFLLILLIDYEYKIRIIMNISLYEINNKSIQIKNKYNNYYFMINFYGNNNNINNIEISNLKTCKVNLYNINLLYYPNNYNNNSNFNIINNNMNYINDIIKNNDNKN